MPDSFHIREVFCPGCLLFWHSRERVIRHLAYNSPVCHDYVLRSFPRMEQEEVDALDYMENLDIQKRRNLGQSRNHTDNRICFRLSGPLPVPFTNGVGNSKPGRPNRVVSAWST